ncbi:tetratricopeptide repeat protein, partial [Microcoleus sp. B7-D4]|uniref:tetratricopeptide repeat protein n=1 Tax=Microcoleus sp. B7-D4 TaxID=2818696 RepID=UPI002FCFBAD5
SENWEVWLKLGNLHAQRGETDSTKIAYDRAIAINPSIAVEGWLKGQPVQWEIFWELGNFFTQQQQWENAIMAYRRLLVINPSFDEGYNKLGEALVRKDQLDGAFQAYQQAITVNPNFAEAHINLGKVLLKQGKFDQAIQHYERAIEINPDLADLMYQLVLDLRLNNEIDKATYCCERLLEINPDLAKAQFQLGNLHLLHGKRVEAMQCYYVANKIKFYQTQIEKGVSPILVCSLPKSGTVYIEESLRKGLKLSSLTRFIHFSVSGEIDLNLELKLSSISDKYVSGLAVAHTNPTEWNIFAISLMLDRLVVNVRDPRQGIISWIDHLSRASRTADDQVELRRLFKLSNSYNSQSFTEKIDYHIEEGYLPYSIKWIEGWLSAEEDPLFMPKILFTKFEDLAERPKLFFESLLEFYEVERASFTFPTPPEFKQGTHYRKGKVDEWREVFTPAQIEKATNMIPKPILKRFGWSEK